MIPEPVERALSRLYYDAHCAAIGYPDLQAGVAADRDVIRAHIEAQAGEIERLGNTATVVEDIANRRGCCIGELESQNATLTRERERLVERCAQVVVDAAEGAYESGDSVTQVCHEIAGLIRALTPPEEGKG